MTVQAPVKPWVNPEQWKQELEDIHDILREAGYDGPLRDVVPRAIGRYERAVKALRAQQEACYAAARDAREMDDDFEASRALTDEGNSLAAAIEIVRDTA